MWLIVEAGDMEFVNAWTVADGKMSVSHVRSHGDMVALVRIVDGEKELYKE